MEPDKSRWKPMEDEKEEGDDEGDTVVGEDEDGGWRRAMRRLKRRFRVQ